MNGQPEGKRGNTAAIDFGGESLVEIPNPCIDFFVWSAIREMRVRRVEYYICEMLGEVPMRESLGETGHRFRVRWLELQPDCREDNGR